MTQAASFLLTRVSAIVSATVEFGQVIRATEYIDVFENQMLAPNDEINKPIKKLQTCFNISEGGHRQQTLLTDLLHTSTLRTKLPQHVDSAQYVDESPKQIILRVFDIDLEIVSFI